MILPVVLSEEEKSQIQTAAFCAYIMPLEKLSQQEAMQRMAQLCAATQVHLGWADRPVRKEWTA